MRVNFKPLCVLGFAMCCSTAFAIPTGMQITPSSGSFESINEVREYPSPRTDLSLQTRLTQLEMEKQSYSAGVIKSAPVRSYVNSPNWVSPPNTMVGSSNEVSATSNDNEAPTRRVMTNASLGEGYSTDNLSSGTMTITNRAHP